MRYWMSECAPQALFSLRSEGDNDVLSKTKSKTCQEISN